MNTTSMPLGADTDRPNGTSPKPVVEVYDYTTGIVGPSAQLAGTVQDGGLIRTGTPPGCWGPMITPKFKGGHEVTLPVAVEGAEVGDAIAIRLKKVRVTSIASSSGVMRFVEGRYIDDPFVAKLCPECGTSSPPSHLEGIGEEAIRCDSCGAEVNAFRFTNGFVLVIDRDNDISVTVSPDIAEKIARESDVYSALPANSQQHSILTAGRADIVGLASRVRPFMGNIGTSPSRDFPDSHNCGDFGPFLVDVSHGMSMSQAEVDLHKTDGHMDTNTVREGAILICPVKVSGGRIYMGDMHAQQGNGEVAGHATDVSGEVELQVEVIKGLKLDGPILLQRPDDLPLLAQPLSAAEKQQVSALAEKYGQMVIEKNSPITFIGTGANLNDATKNGVARAAEVTSLSYDEILNRATIAGSIEISRLPGVVRVTFMCPDPILERMGVFHLIQEQYSTTQS